MTAVVTNGILKPDGVLPFPDQPRVRLAVEPIETRDSAAAWARLKQRIEQHPIAGLMENFSRDALYERD